MKVVVVLSGGQDSTTCLYWALKLWQRSEVLALTFNYNQRHVREVESAAVVAAMAGVQHEIVAVGPILHGSSPLVDQSAAVQHYGSLAEMPGGLERTFVPARNSLFLVLAANRAAVLGAGSIVIGVSQEDFGGYPDCRSKSIRSMETALCDALGDDQDALQILTPLLHLSKKQTVELAVTLPGCMEALAYSHTCYDGQYPPNPSNHASLLRAKGFKEAGVGDPLILRAKREGLLAADYPDHGLVEAAL